MSLLTGRPFVTDGGLETDLIFRRGVDLPEFAAYPLVADETGRAILNDYYDDYAAIARTAGAGLILESPTWRANPDWGAALGDDATVLRETNAAAIALLQDLRETYRAEIAAVLISGQIGPRGDGYRPDTAMTPDEATDYHRPQLATFAGAGADLATALTLTSLDEARGIVRAARDVGLPIGISFTVETDGRLPDGTSPAGAITDLDATDPPDHYLLNCAHPTHIARGLGEPDEPGDWADRIIGIRGNASTLSHAELDEADQLDDGDPATFATDHEALRSRLPQLSIFGGCCGTDARHISALWQALADLPA